MGKKSVHWMVSVFRKGKDELIAKWSLRPMRIDVVQKIFHASVDDLLATPHFLDQIEASALQSYLPKPIELQKYDYILECDQTDPFWAHKVLGLLGI